MKFLWPAVLLVGAVIMTGGCRSREESPLILLPTTAPQSAAAVPHVGDIAAAPAPEEMVAQVTELPPTPLPPTPTLPPPTPVFEPTKLPYTGQPTPDPPHAAPEALSLGEHVVAFGETLAIIAGTYGSTVDELIALNGLANGDFLQAGQVLKIPTTVELVGPATKLIPDSELVYGPATADFAIRAYLGTYYPQSALLAYQETVEGRPLDGVGIAELVALRFSVNPRLLLAMIEHRTGWVSRPATPGPAPDYPMGYERAGYEGLFQQLNWAANRVNAGFYGRAEGGWTSLLVADGTRVAFEPTINHGTAGVQNWLASHTAATYPGWLVETGPAGFTVTYTRLFGNPFALAVEPLLPAALTQPELALPWEADVPWYFTGGPHGGWGSGAAWAALDFGPDRELLGCYVSEAWVTASAPGVVVYSDFGGVVVDLDGDGAPGTGWVIVYWHLDGADRVAAGGRVRTGDRLGHPSCEGGFSNGTHLHIARRYNGRWISADGGLPFEMEGWVVQGEGIEYNGYLVRGEEVKEACICAEDGNEIIR